MASTTEAVRRLTIYGQNVGVTQQTAELQDLARAQGGVAVASNKTEQATVSLDAKFASIERRYIAGVAAQQQYEKVQRAVNAAVAQNPALQDRANAILAEAAKRHDALTGSQKAMGVVTSDLNGRVQASAGAFGIAGAAMSALGPIGIAVAAVLGLLYLSINHMVTEANRLGDGAIAIRTFAETTGLSITQIKTLGKAGAEFGVGTDAIAASVDKFTVSLEEARKSTGPLFDAVRAINGSLATELAATKTTAQAWDVLAKARAAASDQSKNALSKAAFGKGGVETGLVLDVTAEAGGLDALVARQQKLNGLTDEQIKKWAITKVQIDETQKRTANLMAATYTQEVLDRQLQAAQLEERVTRALVEANAQRAKRSYWDLFSAGVDTNPQTPREIARANLTAGLSTGQKPDFSGYEAQRRAIEGVGKAEKDEADVRKAAADAAISSANLLKEEIGYLGSAATADERRTLKLKELNAARLGNKLSEEAYGRAVSAVNLDTAIAKQSAYVGALGASAPVAEIVREKELQLQKQRQQDPRITQETINFQKQLVAAQQLGTAQLDAQTAAEKVRIATLFMSNEGAIAYAIVQTKINEAIAHGRPLTAGQITDLQKSADAFAKARTQADTYVDALQVVKESLTEVGKAAFSSALQGKLGMDGLVSSLDSVAKKLSDKALDNLLSLDPSRMGIGIVQAGASAIISAFTSDQKRQEELRKAREEWAKAGPAFDAFLKQMSGGVQGDLAQRINQAAAQEADFEDKAWKARDTAAIAAARAGIAKFEQAEKDRFNATFSASLDALKDGLGLDSPFMKAVANIKTALNNQLSFIDDADVARGASGVALATAASRTYLLSLLQTTKPLSAVQTGLMQIQGTANALVGALQQLGLSSENTAKAISDGVSKAVDDLKKQFETGLSERLNTARGQSFINDATKLIEQHQQDLLDAVSLGSDPSLVAQVFSAEAQKIVDDANLTGDAFKDFIAKFSPLKDVVHEFTQSAVDDSKALRDAQNGAAKNVLDYLTNLTSGPGSTSSRMDTLTAAAAAYNANTALAIGGNIDAQNKWASLADNLEKAARAVYASSQGYQDIKSQIISQGLALPSVQNTTDPVLAAMRDVLSAINAGNATQALDATLQGVIKAAIDAGNAQQVAAALLPTMGAQLTFEQFVDKVAPLAKDTTAASLLTSAQVTSLGLATNTTVAQLLTSAQLISAVGPLSRDTTVGTLLNASQLATALVPMAKETTLGSLPNYNQFQQLGLSKDTTVGSLLNLSQLTGLGLSRDATVGGVQGAVDALNVGNILKIFQELDGNGNGILEKSEAIAGATTSTQYNTDQSVYLDTLAYSNARSTDANTANAALQGTIGNQLLQTSIQQLALLNSSLNPAANPTIVTFTVAGAGTSNPTPGHISANDQVVTLLTKIAVNTWATAGNTRGLTNAAARDGTFSAGGLVTGPGTGTSDSIRAWLSNHEYVMPAARVEQFGVGFFDQLRDGILPQSIIGVSVNDNLRPPAFSARNVVPLRGGNDNSEIRALRLQLEKLTDLVDQLRRENNSGNEGIARSGREDADTIVGAVNRSGSKQAEAIRHGKRNPRAA
jgi:hypothetical protein